MSGFIDIPIANLRGNTGPAGQGLPGTGAVPADAAVAGYIGAPSSTQTAGDTRWAKKVGVNIADYADLAAAIAALPATGGTVFVPTGRFPVGNWTSGSPMSKENVRIVGEKLPRLSANGDRLENGSVLMGRFNVFASGLEVDGVGFDFGKYVCDTYYSAADQVATSHPLGGSWDAFAFAEPNQGTPTGARRNVRIGSIIGLLRQPNSNGHAVLIEGIDGGAVGRAQGVCGIHAVAVKSLNMQIDALTGFSGSNNHVIIKSDSYAKAGNLQIGEILTAKAPPNITPHWTIVDAQHGVLFNPQTNDFLGSVQVDSIRASGAIIGLDCDGATGRNIADVQIGQVVADGFGSAMDAALRLQNVTPSRWQVRSLIANNTIRGIVLGNGALAVGVVTMTNLTGAGLTANGTSRMRVDSAEFTNVNTAYYIDDTARIQVGGERIYSITTKWGRSAPALAAGWADFGSGNEWFQVVMANYGVELRGLLLASAGVTGTIANFPIYLRPVAGKRFPGYLNNGSRNFALIGAATAGQLTLNDGTAPAAGNYISVDGVAWAHV